MAASHKHQFANLQVDRDPYGVNEEKQKQRERFKAMREVADTRPRHDPRGQGYSSDQVEHLVMQGSYVEGVKTAGAAMVTFGSAAYAANVYSPWFRTRLGPSGKMAMVVMPVLGLTALSMELYIGRARKDPQTFLDNYLGFKAPVTDNGEFDDSALSAPKRFANLIYNYPYRTLMLSGTAAVGTVFALQPKNLTLQQKILHSRVMGQMSVLGILCSVMGFMDFMRRRGGEFRE